MSCIYVAYGLFISSDSNMLLPLLHMFLIPRSAIKMALIGRTALDHQTDVLGGKVCT